MATTYVTDKIGLVKENEHLTVYFPQNNKAMVFRVVSRYNAGFEEIDYGKLPIESSTILKTYEGSNVTVAATGRFPARSYATGVKFKMNSVWDSTDMWYVPYTWTNRVWHSKLMVRPSFLRVGVQIPQNVNQQRYQREQVVGGVDAAITTYDDDSGSGSYPRQSDGTASLGFQRGGIELVHFPEIHYGYTFGNDTNMALNTRAKFVYGEYIVEIPNSADFIYSILNRQVPSHWVSMPTSTTDSQINQGLRKTWGFEGFTLYPSLKKSTAIQDYNQILNSKDVQGRGVTG
jgi:hypothetical protein